MIARGWGRNAELVLSGCGVSVLQNERVLEMGGGDVNHLSATVLYTEMVKIVNFMLCLFFLTTIKISKDRVSESLQMTLVGGPLGVPVLHGISKWVTCECAGVVQLAALPEERRSPPGSGWLPWNLAMVGALGRVTELSLHIFVLIVASCCHHPLSAKEICSLNSYPLLSLLWAST